MVIGCRELGVRWTGASMVIGCRELGEPDYLDLAQPTKPRREQGSYIAALVFCQAGGHTIVESAWYLISSC